MRYNVGICSLDEACTVVICLSEKTQRGGELVNFCSENRNESNGLFVLEVGFFL